jgi:glycosyltransferase involved in cell wall biosynthesis
LAAYSQYAIRQKTPPWALCLLGDGILKEALLVHCQSLGLEVVERAPWEDPPHGSPPRVFFPGFRQIDDLPRFYANAGVFVHASTTEQWGLVVNEAMASGLPVLVSNRVGCAQDLVQEGINGFTFDPMNVAKLSDMMVKITEMPPSTLFGFGEASRRLIADWRPERFASGVRSACEKALEIGPKRAGLMDRLLLFLLALK